MAAGVKSTRLRRSAQLKLSFPIKSRSPSLTWPNELPCYTTQRQHSHDKRGYGWKVAKSFKSNFLWYVCEFIHVIIYFFSFAFVCVWTERPCVLEPRAAMTGFLWGYVCVCQREIFANAGVFLEQTEHLSEKPLPSRPIVLKGSLALSCLRDGDLILCVCVRDCAPW